MAPIAWGFWPGWPEEKDYEKPDGPDDAMSFDIDGATGFGATDNRPNQTAQKIKEALLEIYTASKKKNTNVYDWKDKAENVFAEIQHIYGQKGKTGQKETELITDICWTMWELNELIGEFAIKVREHALKNNDKIQKAIRKNAKSLASKIDGLYNPSSVRSRGDIFNSPFLRRGSRHGTWK